MGATELNDRVSGHAAEGGRYTVLAVCTANHCRSPVMQFLLGEALGADFDVWSAGVDADDGVPMHPLAIEVLAARGIDGSHFRSRHLRPAMIDEADLVLTADATHRSAVVALRPAAVNRTFALKQFARLLASTHATGHPGVSGDPGVSGVSGGTGVAQAIDRARRARVGSTGDDDLADPIGRSADAFVAMAVDVTRAAATIAAEAGVGSGDAASTCRGHPENLHNEETCSFKTT